MSLFILCVIEIYYRIIKVDIDGIDKNYGIYKEDDWYIIPTIKIIKSSKYLEIIVIWLCFRYNNSYKISKDEEEK